jgi:anaerobic selenocysteine-containing dehydrogenase
MTTRTAYSFCRICSGSCGVKVRIEGGRMVAMHGDRDNPLTRGYMCFKGLQSIGAHYSPDRVMHPLKRQDNGEYARIGFEQAMDEIAERLDAIRARDGAEAIGLYVGNGAFPNAANIPLHFDFMRALGSPSKFTSASIDQSAKMVSFERLGGWAAPKPHLDQSDVAMMIGGNPLVTHQTSGIVDVDPARTLKRAKARGLKLIVIDPRHHETARHADVFLQPLPGHDAAIVAALLKIVLDEGLQDASFCMSHVGRERMDALRVAVAPFSAERVATMAGVRADQLREAARIFGRARQGVAYAFTGTTMGPHSNVAQHLADCLNVVCGRFLRAGDPVLTADMLGAPPQYRAEVIPPTRSWENAGGMSRIRGAKTMFGEKMTGNLADEILVPGANRIRALINHGGNPAVSVPDQQKMVRAFRDLELSVTIDPFMTNSARLSHYVVPTKMQFERADLPLSIMNTLFYPRPWVQYAAPLVDPPAGSEVVDDWYVFWSIAKRLGLPLRYADRVPLDMTVPPTTDTLLGIRAMHPAAPLEEIKKHPHGMSFDALQLPVVEPGRADAGRFDVMPGDVAAELRLVEAELKSGPTPDRNYPYLLAARRMPHVYNSVTRASAGISARTPHNPAYMSPTDLKRLSLVSGDRVTISSDHGHITAMVESDPSLRPGVVSMSHSWGGLPGDDESAFPGACTNRLISSDRNIEAVNAMPRMTAIPVAISRLEQVHSDVLQVDAITARRLRRRTRYES